MWPFKPRPLLPEETMRWHADVACWFGRHYGRTPTVTDARLILPGRGFYRLGKATGDDLAQRIFDQTKTFAGMSGRPGQLPGQLDANVDDAYSMVAMSVRVLANDLIQTADEPPPVDDQDIGATADAIACLMGFGVFLANLAVTERRVGGHKVSTLEYIADPLGGLSEPDLVFAIALFLTFRELPPATAAEFLEPLLAEMLPKAMKDAAAFRDEMKTAAW